MPELKETTYTQYIFSEEEEIAAQVFPEMNRLWLQTQLGICAEERQDLVYDPLRPAAMGFADAYLRGQADILKYVLGISEDRKSALQKHLEEVMASQQQESSVPSPGIIPKS